jgi:hypothetical protein
MRFGYCLASESPIPGVDATNQRWLLFACAFQAEIGE